MNRKLIGRTRALLLAVGFALAAGCSDSGATVSGQVTYEGEPVKQGYITFAPADGKGPVAGGAITDGRYTVEKLTPGSKLVRVEASSGPGPSVQSSADGEKLSKEWRAKMGPDGVIRTETVPDAAVGNNAPAEIKAGAQTLNLTLTKPAPKGK